MSLVFSTKLSSGIYLTHTHTHSTNCKQVELVEMNIMSVVVFLMHFWFGFVRLGVGFFFCRGLGDIVVLKEGTMFSFRLMATFVTPNTA